ncbi:hypothetical protein [Nocardia vulneris]|uniref:Toxin n=1 Tax=Nocardia vulneris TaxID=1141657 RepID=A0ABR4Z733_9NOCA|nr:hypothetical protein [Nocardia vulneris]KIA61092.1 hypothetical protein FG87_33215 [Nocardia vulneris]
MRRGEVYRFERDRPSLENDPRTPYRVVVSADYRLPDERVRVLTAPVERLDPQSMVAVRLGNADPVEGWIRVDLLASTYRPWLAGPLGELCVETMESLSSKLRIELDL